MNNDERTGILSKPVVNLIWVIVGIGTALFLVMHFSTSVLVLKAIKAGFVLTVATCYVLSQIAAVIANEKAPILQATLGSAFGFILLAGFYYMTNLEYLQNALGYQSLF